MPVACKSRVLCLIAAGMQGFLAWGVFATHPSDVAVGLAEEVPEFAAPTTHDRVGRIVAPVMINGQGPFRLIVDTGASHSTISERAAQILGITLTDASTVMLNGVTGSAMVPMMTIDRIESGDLVIENSRVAIIGGPMLADTDGVLGLAGTRSKRLTVDFKRDRVTITRSRRPTTDAYLRFRVQRIKGGMLAVNARVSGIRAQAVIDTGASHSFANLALCTALEEKARRMAKVPPIKVFGATPDVSVGQIRRVSQVQLGRDVGVNDVELICGDFHIFKVWEMQSEPVLVIGMDVLGAAELLIIDFGRPEVHILPRRAVPLMPVHRGR